MEPWRKIEDVGDWLVVAGFSDGLSGFIALLVVAAWTRVRARPVTALRVLTIAWGFVCLSAGLSVRNGEWYTHIPDEERLALGMGGFVALGARASNHLRGRCGCGASPVGVRCRNFG